VVFRSGQQATQADLRRHLKETLPEYMVPAAFVTLEALPLTPNGKVDRKALPAPENRLLPAELVSARTPTEEVVSEIWAEVLRVNRVGVMDDFFELGGHSLLATQVVSRIRQAFQLEIPLRGVFESPTVAGLAQRIETLRREKGGLSTPPLAPVPRTQSLPLSFAQQRLWFLDQLEPNNPLYNIPNIMRLRGALSAEALQQAINRIVERHESLRTTFHMQDDQPVQVIAPSLTVSIAFTDLTSVPAAEREDQARSLAMQEVKRPFDLRTGPLLRALLFKLDTEDHVLVLNTHHIISDRWSMAVLMSELAAVYEADLAGRELELPHLKVQYADYALWQRQWLSGPVMDEQLEYWRRELDGAPSVLELPTDRPRQALENFWGGIHRHDLQAQLVADLRKVSRSHSATLFMTLLAAFDVLLWHLSGQNDIVVGTDLANRTQVETEKLIGFFVNLLPIRAKFNHEWTFSQFLGHIRETTLGAFAHQDLPFEKLVEELRPERSLTHNPLVQVLFVMQNIPHVTRDFGGLKTGPLGVSSTSRFDLVLFINDPDGSPYATWMYNPNLFDASTISLMSELYQAVLTAVARETELSLSALTERLREATKEHGAAQQRKFQQASINKLRGMKRKPAGSA
jgi:acyl carrier protein